MSTTITTTPLSTSPLSVFLYHLRDHLVTQNAFFSLASLAQTNRELQAIFEPALQGWRITLQGQESRQVFRDIMGADSWSSSSRQRSHSAPARTSTIARSSRNIASRFGPYAPFPPSLDRAHTVEPWQIDSSPNKQKSRMHHRRLRVLQKCEVLTVLDFTGAETLIEAIIAAGDDEEAFRSVPSVCLGPDLLWRLAEGTDHTKDIVNHLKERLRPRHVCFALSIGNKRETMARLERIGRMPPSDSWSRHYVRATSNVIQNLCEAWAPESITIHGLTAENIPAVYSLKTTVFFGPPPDVQARVDPLFWRADVRATEIANGVVIMNEDESAVFVGAEEFVSRDGLREEELGRVSVEERVWQNIVQPHVREELRGRVRFVAREEAVKCGCCGKK